MRRSSRTVLVASLAAFTGFALAPDGADATTAPTCPQTSNPTAWSGAYLDTNTTKAGTVYNGAGPDLELNKSGAVFNTKQMTTTSDMVYAAVGDFNKDGWPDFVGANESSSNGYLDIFQNYT